MSIKQLIILGLIVLLAGCTIKRELVVPLEDENGTPISTPTKPTPPVANPSGEWKAETGGAGGFNATETFKNFQYTLEVAAANTPVSIGLTSPDIDVQFALFNPLGQRVAISSSGRSVSDQYMLNAGSYRVVVMAARQAVGRFTLNLSGTKDGATRIRAQVLQSGMQDWGPLGGGGRVKSTKNHFYSFDITEDNTTIDLEIESGDTETSLFLYNSLEVAVVQKWGSRYLFQLIATKKGTYTVMAGTTSRGNVGKYSLRIFGKVANLQRIPSVSADAKGTWASGNSSDTYSIQITDNNAPLDIDLASADTRVRITLRNNVGDRIDGTAVPGKSAVLTFESVPKGTYRIVVQPINPNFDPGGAYTMNVFGRFTDFKKL